MESLDAKVILVLFPRAHQLGGRSPNRFGSRENSFQPRGEPAWKHCSPPEPTWSHQVDRTAKCIKRGSKLNLGAYAPYCKQTSGAKDITQKSIKQFIKFLYQQCIGGCFVCVKDSHSAFPFEFFHLDFTPRQYGALKACRMLFWAHF